MCGEFICSVRAFLCGARLQRLYVMHIVSA